MLARRAALLLPLLPAFAHAQANDPAAPIARLDQALLAAMHAGRATPFAARYAALAPAVQAAFDLPAILAASIGLGWSSIPPAQQQTLLAAFTRFTIATYAGNFDNFNGERIDLLPARRQVGQDVVVATQIVPANGAPTRIDYVMRRTAQGWRAIDVLFDGSISRVAVQRSDFRSVLASGGAPALAATLDRKTAALSGGATLP